MSETLIKPTSPHPNPSPKERGQNPQRVSI